MLRPMLPNFGPLDGSPAKTSGRAGQKVWPSNVRAVPVVQVVPVPITSARTPLAKIENGGALCIVTGFFSCQPPTTASNAGEMPEAYRRLRPIGMSQTLANVKRWRTSKSELPLSNSGCKGFVKPHVLGPVPPRQKLPGELSIACDQV